MEKLESQAKKAKKPNRLAGEASTYLKQHALNPVDWFPWGEEALQKAKSEEKPILLSVGYAACHWCHVMEHESFEDDETAEIMNQGFVNIKVDREERTDIDEIYMKAVQVMTGHGGWPMTVFLTPELKPFFGGTYFPPVERHGMPSFKRVLKQVLAAWQNNREDLAASAEELTEHLRLMDRVKSAENSLSDHLKVGDDYLNYGTISSALEKFLRNFDATYGGFGGAPKFPHSFAIELCMRAQDRVSQVQDSRKKDCLTLVEKTLDGMAIGGIHDQIGGGFARYSVDRKWLIPHFEKMLYDNALLARTYLDGYQLKGNRFWLHTAERILSFVDRELGTEIGGFYSSLDADSEGEEGKFYVFTREELKQILGERDGLWFADLMGVSESGNFEHGKSVLHFQKPPQTLAKERDLNYEDFMQRVTELGDKLLIEREKRVRPGRDEKILTSWNALMFSAFIQAYQVTGKDEYRLRAEKGLRFLLEHLLVQDKTGKRLLRVYGSKLPGYLDDYGAAILALLDMASIDTDGVWLKTAVELADSVLALFADSEEGGFFYTAKDHETLIVRPRSHFDGSVPSGTSSTCMAFLRLARLTNLVRFEQAADDILKLYGPNLTRLSDQFANLICCLDFKLSQPKEIAVVLPAKQEKGEAEMLLALYKNYSPSKVVAVKRDGTESDLELFKGRESKGGTTIYVCQNFSCQAPIAGAKALSEEMKNW